MFVHRDRTQEYREELEGILMDRIRELHQMKTEYGSVAREFNREICELAEAFVMVSLGGENQAQDGSEQACKSCNRVDCRKRI